ncbi:MAG: AAA family ATPase [Patescibacteria group bacterium]|nr:AAA family ATPase [Patescibacteria group bacterium]
MKDFSFPIFKTKTEGETQTFALDDPVERRKYFDLKARPEIEKLRTYLKKNTFVGFLLGKKNSGKGTYSKLFAEAIGPEYIQHISVGDIVRSVHSDFENDSKRGDLMDFLKKKYRGFVPLEDAIEALLGRSTEGLLPTELILTLVEREISRVGRKAIFIDGFPRNPDQVSHSLYFRHLMGYRDDPDFFVFIDLPETIIDERMRYRVVCPKCQTPRNIKLLRTKEVGYDEKKKEFYLICDNSSCGGERMVPKEGDELGIEAVRERIEIDDVVMRMLMGLEGVPKIFLRNAIPTAVAKEYVDDYEITPAYRYDLDSKSKKVRMIEEPWVVNDEKGNPSYSLLPPPIVVSFIIQTAKILGL